MGSHPPTYDTATDHRRMEAEFAARKQAGQGRRSASGHLREIPLRELQEAGAPQKDAPKAHAKSRIGTLDARSPIFCLGEHPEHP